jgi:hypothetical protein
MATGIDNHRDFYRIECRAIVSCRVLGATVPRGASPGSHFDEDPALALSRELLRLDQDNSALLHAISEKDRAAGAYLAVVNRKIELLARHLLAQSPEATTGEEQTISLSEGGVAWHTTQPLPEGAIVALRLMLLPAWTAVTTYAEVIKAEHGGAEPLVNASFENLEEADRQLIARHVMQVQMAEQRRRAGRD